MTEPIDLQELNYPEPLSFQGTYLVQDPSKIQCFMECPRKYFYSYILGWQNSEPNRHLIFGEAWHRAIAHILTHGHDDDAIKGAMLRFMDYYRQTFDADTDMDYHPKSPAMVLQILTEYCERVRQTGEDFEVVSTDGKPMVEVHGAVPLLPSFVVTMRIDAICRWTAGAHKDKYFILEHKTTGRADAKWMRQWSLSMQVFTYIHALHCIYGPENVYGAIIQGAHFKKSYKAEESAIIRVPVWRDYAAICAWYSDATFWLESILSEFQELQADRKKHRVMCSFPRNTQNCNMYFGCPFYDFCLGWPNPLFACHEPPPGFEVKHWDPRKREEEIKEAVHVEFARKGERNE